MIFRGYLQVSTLMMDHVALLLKAKMFTTYRFTYAASLILLTTDAELKQQV